MPLPWIILGFVLGLIVVLPIARLLLRRGELRARRAERRARQSERLAELGAMTGGLAHEIKNPLSTIGLNAQLLGEALEEVDLPEEERGRLMRRLDALAREAERLRGILADFLEFAGRIKLDPQPRDLVTLVEELRDFFLPQCDQAGIILRTQLPVKPITLAVDEGLIKQAILNLMINATEAMKSAAAADAAERGTTARIGDLMLRVDADGTEARVHVIDTGPGVDAGRIEEIFHPYVSTKASGTGLGLPTARRIVEEHGGRLEAHSEPGRGSDFIVHLPMAAKAEE